jgi:methyl coenzyme M reductase subunit D
MNLEINDLLEATRNLRCDVIFTRQDNERKIKEIIKSSYPYGYEMGEGDALRHKCEQKQRKYVRIAKEARTSRPERVRVMIMIVSSLGVVQISSLK